MDERQCESWGQIRQSGDEMKTEIIDGAEPIAMRPSNGPPERTSPGARVTDPHHLVGKGNRDINGAGVAKETTKLTSTGSLTVGAQPIGCS